MSSSPPRLSLTVLRLSLLLAGCSGAEGPPADSPPCQPEADPDRSRCEDLAVRAAVACSGQPDRTSLFERYGKLCAAERANVLASGLNCLVEQSQGSCRTFSDPSGADKCLSALPVAFDTEQSLDLARKIASLCGGGEAEARSLLVHTEPPLAVLSYSTLQAIWPCIDRSSTCAAASRCFSESFWDNGVPGATTPSPSSTPEPSQPAEDGQQI